MPGFIHGRPGVVLSNQNFQNGVSQTLPRISTKWTDSLRSIRIAYAVRFGDGLRDQSTNNFCRKKKKRKLIGRWQEEKFGAKSAKWQIFHSFENRFEKIRFFFSPFFTNEWNEKICRIASYLCRTANFILFFVSFSKWWPRLFRIFYFPFHLFFYSSLFLPALIFFILFFSLSSFPNSELSQRKLFVYCDDFAPPLDA